MEAFAPDRARTAAVTGATSGIGHFLVPRLLQQGFRVHALSRRPRPAGPDPRLEWHARDIAPGLGDWPVDGIDCLFHLAPLWLLPPLVPDFARRGVRRVLAFGSTSRFTKDGSGDPAEQALARRLADAESALARAGHSHDVAWTLFRPTLIYGGPSGGALGMIAAVIRRAGFFPLAGGAGRRQPVHAGDLAAACLLSLDCEAARDRAYDLVGGTTLTYRAMVEAVFRGLGRKPVLVPVPAWSLRLLARGVAVVRPGLGVGAGMVDRMNVDLCFDAADAVRDFGYTSRAFAYDPAGGGA